MGAVVVADSTTKSATNKEATEVDARSAVVVVDRAMVEMNQS